MIIQINSVMTKRVLALLSVFGVVLASCGKQEPSQNYRSISFDNHSFKVGKNNNAPTANGDSTYTEFGATFAVNYYYSYLSGVMLSDGAVKPDLEGEFVGYPDDVKGVINTAITGDKDYDATLLNGAAGTSAYSVWFYDPVMHEGQHPALVFEKGVSHKIQSLYVNNTARNWQRMHIGFYSKPGFVEGDFFEVSFIGYDIDGKKTGEQIIALGDYRGGKTFVMDRWTEVDLSLLGDIHELRVDAAASENFVKNHCFGSADNFSFAVCVDEIKFQAE